MTLMMKNSSVRIGKLDKENYNLLVEWEQYRAENVRIQSFRDKSEKNIRAMVRSDRRVSDWIQKRCKPLYKKYIKPLEFGTFSSFHTLKMKLSDP